MALLTVKETAKLLGVCLASAYAMVERGELEHLRIGNLIRIVVRRRGASRGEPDGGT